MAVNSEDSAVERIGTLCGLCFFIYVETGVYRAILVSLGLIFGSYFSNLVGFQIHGGKANHE